MHQLHVSNEALGDRAALDAAWDRDGYWFFRDVLDHGAIARLREVYLGELAKLGVIEVGDPQARHNGAGLERVPPKLETLSERRAYRSFTAEPSVHDFFRRLLGDEPFWIPTVEYHTTPPTRDRSRNRYTYVHQDGFYNDGVPFRICWIPLVPIDESVGGIVVAGGLHKGPCLHDRSSPPLFPIPDGAVPEAAWCRTNYLPGDLLMFDLNLPHTGLSNHSDRFRLSMDIRVMGASEDTPAVGPVIAIGADSISVRRADDGRVATFALDESTYCRGGDGKKTSPAEFSRSLKVGAEAIVAGRNGLATLVRTPS
jgi:hypothetical protein